jgi:hypothetical protein
VTQHWDPDFASRSPMFAPLRHVADALKTRAWPALQDLQRIAAERRPPIVTAGGAPLAFVAQEAKPRHAAERYEARIHERGEVQMRHASWHDLMNALVWLTFPRAKAALNARHFAAFVAQQARGAPNRGPLQDALTLFDEGGVIVVASDVGLLRDIERFAWKHLFWHQRARVAAGMRFYLFGHALYEKALAPFVGITGRALLFERTTQWLAAPLAAQIEALDGMVSERLLDPAGLRSTRDLAPLPILGVPGWCPHNEQATYYDDASYFRPGRAR